MATAMTHPALTGQLFEAFTEGHAAYQARDELAQQITVEETRMVSLIRNGALGGIDQLEPSLLTPSNNPGLALDSLRLLADKARLERADQRLTSEASDMMDLFMGREVRIEAIEQTDNPITRYTYPTTFLGDLGHYFADSRTRQKVHGKITELDRQRGFLWVSRKTANGQIGRHFAGPHPPKWRVAMPTSAAETPLVRIDFVM